MGIGGGGLTFGHYAGIRGALTIRSGRAGAGAILAEVFTAAEKERQMLDRVGFPAASTGFDRVGVEKRVRGGAHLNRSRRSQI